MQAAEERLDELEAMVRSLQAEVRRLESAGVQWVMEDRLRELTGLKPGEIRHRVESGLWVKGRHYKTTDGTRGRLYNVPEIDRWHSEREHVHRVTGRRSRSGSRLQAVSTPRPSPGDRPKLI